MKRSYPLWKPNFNITPSIARALMEIESARVTIDHVRLSPAREAEFRHRARVRATHYSTRIEGNRLTLAQAEQVINEPRRRIFHGRERDVKEVKNYWKALLRVEEWAIRKQAFTEDLIRRLHALVESGSRSKPSPYRPGQNVIRDSASGAIVYMPPEAKDIPGLMAGMVRWARKAEKEGVPVPILASLVHYQFVTIHPYFDGNGRTARLLATFILHRGGFSLNGFFSMEEHHARDLEGYYRALAVHPHHNYYEGRAQADLTPWVEYFIQALSNVFRMVSNEVSRTGKSGKTTEPKAPQDLDRRARVVFGLFGKQNAVRTSDISQALGLSDRMARVLICKWVADGWLTVKGTGRRDRTYELSAIYR